MNLEEIIEASGRVYEGNGTKYRYSVKRPSPWRMDAGDVVGHQKGWRKRTNLLGPPGKQLSYQASCSCGWKDSKGGWFTFQAMKRRFEAHIGEVDKQGELF